ncbi:MAG: 16S rRNA (cytosine(1402)-N(4))-methyltransferase RsmH [Minisyncoccia bacterium]
MAIHKPVLLQETITNLKLSAGMVVVDGTLGGGGHAREIIKSIAPNGTLVGVDVDNNTLDKTKSELEVFAKELSVHAIFANDSFRNLKEITSNASLQEVNAILLDLGFSSDQMDLSGRGFSHQRDEPLQMNLATTEGITALDIVNTWDEAGIEEILRDYGEEQFATEIAKKICEVREQAPIMKTTDLVQVIMSATPSWYHHRKIHPATKTFQALRIAVNDELGALREFLQQVPSVIASKGRLAVISFHSLEDRIVKLQFVAWERSGIAKRVNKKVIKPEREEVLTNRRSRSAKLRVCEFI